MNGAKIIKIVLLSGLMVFPGCNDRECSLQSIRSTLINHFEMYGPSEPDIHYVQFLKKNPNADLCRFPFIVHINSASLKSECGNVGFWWIGCIKPDDQVAFVDSNGKVLQVKPFKTIPTSPQKSRQEGEDRDRIIETYTGLSVIGIENPSLRRQVRQGKVKLHFYRNGKIISPSQS